jgi:RNA polymerase sigma-32 factor
MSTALVAKQSDLVFAVPMGDLGVAVSDVREIEQRLSVRDMSFDPAPDADEEEAYSPALYLPAANADPAVQLEREAFDEDATDRLASALETLDEHSRQIETTAIGKLKKLMAA